MRTGPAKGATKPASSLIWLFTLVVWTGVVVALGAAELKPQTIKAFDRYVEVTEARMQTELDGEAPFLWVDRLPDDDRDEANAKLRAGEVVIDRLETRDGDEKIEIPDGTIHHWIGTVLIPGVTLEQTMALIQDYDRYAEIYGPDVRQSKLLSRDGSRFRVYLQLFKKKVVTVVLNTEYDAEFVRLEAGFKGSSQHVLPSVAARTVPYWRAGRWCSRSCRAATDCLACEIRSPSQCPGTARSSASAGRALIMMSEPTNSLPRPEPSARVAPTTRIVEVEHPDTPDEREKPEGLDHGFMWRFNNYCSYEERADDTYMQCESITLTRGIPFFLHVFIRPFVNGIPKDGLTFTLEATRRHLTD